jgi:hypothetical protein
VTDDAARHSADRISFAGTPCPAGFAVRTLILQPGEAIGYRPVDWVDALLVVERGELEIQCQSGTGARFGDGRSSCSPAWRRDACGTRVVVRWC